MGGVSTSLFLGCINVVLKHMKTKINNKKRVAIVGLGYVGLPLAIQADLRGHEVVGVDINEDKIRLLQQRKAPFTDRKIQTDLLSAKLSLSTDYAAIEGCDVVIICVPTPVKEDHHTPDLEPVKSAAVGVGEHLQRDQLIILESTVNPGVTEEVVLPILEEKSGLKGGIDFYLAHCPERINPGDLRWHVGNIPRVVGSLEEEGLNRAYAFYKSIVSAQVTKMGSLKEAEAVKIVENSFRDVNIAFVNELAMSFSRLGIDVLNVIRGAATKPFGFVPHYPSCGVGGHCIPVDPYYLIEYAQKNGFNHDFLSLARKINNHMPEFTVQRLIFALSENNMGLKGLPVAVLGLSYKANIDDCRESPSFEIIRHLQHHGADVRIYDPYVPDKSNVGSLTQALLGAKAAVIATAHDEFKGLTPENFVERDIKVVMDGCNCLPKDEFINSGLVYRGIGR